MPELPEVEVLVRHLDPLLRRAVIRRVEVFRDRCIRPHARTAFISKLKGATIQTVTRRAKSLVFALEKSRPCGADILIGHLGMTGRFYVLPQDRARHSVRADDSRDQGGALGTDALFHSMHSPLKHIVATFDLGDRQLIFQDTRYFGRLHLSPRELEGLGPEPLSRDFSIAAFAAALKRSKQPIKVRLLDQALVAGIGNIYASEALFRAGISPRLPSNRLTRNQVQRLHREIRFVLRRAIRFGSTIPLDWSGGGKGDGLFYYGSIDGSTRGYEERLEVYDREGKPCRRCRTPIRRIVQSARSTFYCPRCQRG